ncbi:PREDICTED: uncharacterized protein LOC106819403 [Priapulus caudatus]|uniref:Uncharacterized protein LOC106819403 n=1 Tax=Priapulus caudatus TaxID=37621 RepID=A0ABM1F509_PRICU|nr:PREDICTED: uncharacterized protein LOC106819403 [Priapulus caudatus]
MNDAGDAGTPQHPNDPFTVPACSPKVAVPPELEAALGYDTECTDAKKEELKCEFIAVINSVTYTLHVCALYEGPDQFPNCLPYMDEPRVELCDYSGVEVECGEGSTRRGSRRLKRQVVDETKAITLSAFIPGQAAELGAAVDLRQYSEQEMQRPAAGGNI